MNTILAVFIGGGLGSLARFGVGKFSESLFSTSFPLGTLFSNLLSCAVLALSVGFFGDRVLANPSLRFLVLTGFCGGFSTFSTFSHETLVLMRSGNYIFAISNIAINVVVCISIIFFLSKSN